MGLLAGTMWAAYGESWVEWEEMRAGLGLLSSEQRGACDLEV